jgi:hypothetical protein
MWPKSGWTQAGIASVASIATSYAVFIRTENSLFAQYAKEAPYDGQDGLSAFVGAAQAAAFTFVGVFLVLFVLQRFLTSISQRNSL